MASYNTEELLCVKCGEPSSKGNVYSKVGAPKRKREGICENDPPEKLTEQSEKLKLKELTKILKNNKATHEPTHIHSTCRTFTNNKTRAKRTSDAQDDQVCANRFAPENVKFCNSIHEGEL